MNKSLLLGMRVLRQLSKDPKLYGLSIMAPLILIYFFKLFADSMPMGFPAPTYAVPIAAFIIHFLAFILCAIVLVQERTKGTLERILISGFRKYQIIGGYLIGYLFLATLQAVVVLIETVWLFKLDYSHSTLLTLFLVMWLLAIVSVLLGIFISTFAKNEGQVFPFIPLIILPSVFLSGLIIDPAALPLWARALGKCFPLYHANKIIQAIIKPDWHFSQVSNGFLILGCYAVGLLILASLTLRDTE